MAPTTGSQGAIGIFDSGIGGLSILRHVKVHLPQENLLYFADSGFAPYGERSEGFVARRSLAIADFLLQRGAKALVVACNTATAAAIRALRERYPDLPVVGVEPGLKPATLATTSRIVGVLATERTLSSGKFKALQEQVSANTGIRFLLQPCIGLAHAVEQGELDGPQTAAMVKRYVAPLIAQGADTLVLGCTHYPFVQSLIEQTAAEAGCKARIIDTGEPVTRQLRRLLEAEGMLSTDASAGTLEAFTTGEKTALTKAFADLLGLHPGVVPLPASESIPA